MLQSPPTGKNRSAGLESWAPWPWIPGRGSRDVLQGRTSQSVLGALLFCGSAALWWHSSAGCPPCSPCVRLVPRPLDSARIPKRDSGRDGPESWARSVADLNASDARTLIALSADGLVLGGLQGFEPNRPVVFATQSRNLFRANVTKGKVFWNDFFPVELWEEKRVSCFLLIYYLRE